MIAYNDDFALMLIVISPHCPYCCWSAAPAASRCPRRRTISSCAVFGVYPSKVHGDKGQTRVICRQLTFTAPFPSRRSRSLSATQPSRREWLLLPLSGRSKTPSGICRTGGERALLSGLRLCGELQG